MHVPWGGEKVKLLMWHVVVDILLMLTRQGTYTLGGGGWEV